MIEFADRIAKLVAANDVETAAKLVDAVSQSDPAAHQLGLAVLALFRKDAEAARTHAQQALKLGAGSVAHQYLAMANLMGGNPAAAIEHANKAVSVDGSPRARSGLGSVLLAAGRPDEAATVLRQVVAETPNDGDALLNLASASAQLADYGEAITFYSRAFDKNPNDQRPIQNLIAMYAELGKWLGAVAALELSRKGEPPPEVAVALDLVMVHLVRLIATKFPQPTIAPDADEAVANLVANALRRAPATQLVVARTLIDLGRIDDAKRLALQTERQPLDETNRASLLYIKGFFAERDGDKQRALELYLQALAVDASRLDATVNAISLLLEDGSPAAFTQIGTLLDKVPAPLRSSNPELMFNESVYLARTNRRLEAKAHLERIIRLTNGEGRAGELARQALAELTKSS